MKLARRARLYLRVPCQSTIETPDVRLSESRRAPSLIIFRRRAFSDRIKRREDFRFVLFPIAIDRVRVRETSERMAAIQLKQPIQLESNLTIRNAVEADCDQMMGLINVTRCAPHVSFSHCSLAGAGRVREAPRPSSNQRRK